MAGENLIANERVETLKEQLTTHPIYEAVETLQDLRCFMEHHIFAVWDFMSLLKALQAAVAPAQTPWMPSPRPDMRRFINEIVLGEECDEYEVAGTRRFISHFELYLLSMEEVKADTRPIRQFISVVNESGVEESRRGRFLGNRSRPLIETPFALKRRWMRCRPKATIDEPGAFNS